MSRMYAEAPALGRDDDSLKPSAFETAQKHGGNLRLVKKGEKPPSANTEDKESTPPGGTVEDFAAELEVRVQRKISEGKNRKSEAMRDAKRLFKKIDSQE